MKKFLSWLGGLVVLAFLVIGFCWAWKTFISTPPTTSTIEQLLTGVESSSSEAEKLSDARTAALEKTVDAYETCGTRLSGRIDAEVQTSRANTERLEALREKLAATRMASASGSKSVRPSVAAQIAELNSRINDLTTGIGVIRTTVDAEKAARERDNKALTDSLNIQAGLMEALTKKLDAITAGH